MLHDFIYYSISRVTSRRSDVNNNITIPTLWPTWFSRQNFLSAKDMDIRVFHNNTFFSNDVYVFAIEDHDAEIVADFFFRSFRALLIP